ncbi:MAG: DUF2384 domain-containing protein [Gammaproteobacteria bacterium]|nr:DUF2384 domain-containing protein [Gammaproteobacteria bacterium]
MIENSETQNAFLAIVNTDFQALPSDPLIRLALGIWYENFVPNLEQLDTYISFARAGYVLERLLAFHCVTSDVRTKIKPRIKTLAEKLEPYFTILPISTTLELRDNCGDPLAHRWGLRDSLSFQIQSILPYQTRHYIHKNANATNMNLNESQNETLRRAVGGLNSWGCSVSQQCSILGISKNSLIGSQKSILISLKLSSQQSQRVQFINFIDEAIRAQFNNPDNIREFMRMPNKNSFFKGQTPISLIENGGVEQLRELSRRLWSQILGV